MFPTDKRPPSNIDLDSFQSSSSPPQSRPISEPTFASYLILRRSLGEIVARITQHFQRLDGGGSYANVEALDKELRGLREGLPKFMAFEHTDRSHDQRESLFWPEINY